MLGVNLGFVSGIVAITMLTTSGLLPNEIKKDDFRPRGILFFIFIQEYHVLFVGLSNDSCNGEDNPMLMTKANLYCCKSLK